MKVLIIIPAYNEQSSVVNVVKSLSTVKSKDFALDYIVINDGSKDSTKEVCEVNKLNYLDLPINLGIGGAVQTGYKYAYLNDYDIAIQFDGDNQHDASFIPDLVKEIQSGFDIVIGSRYIKKISEFQSTALRRIGIKFLSFLIKLCTKKRIYDPTSGFRAVNRKIITLFENDYPLDYPEPDTIVTMIKSGFKVSEIPVKMRERITGKSSLSSPFKAMFYMIKVSLAILVASISWRD